MGIERTATKDGGTGTVQDRLRAALTQAMKARDAVAVAALRSALGAIGNAEAVDTERAPQPGTGHPRLAGTVSGLRAAEVERRSLSEAELTEIIRAEVVDRHAAAHDYERAGHRTRAERLRNEATVLSSYVDGWDTPPRRTCD